MDFSLIRRDQAQPTQSLCLLGASGSVGGTTIRYLKRVPGIRLESVSVHSSLEKLQQLLQEFRPELACISHEDAFDYGIDDLKSQFPAVRFFRGADGLVEMVQESRADTVLTAVVGACGIRATVAGIESGKKIALANKETLVTAGPAIQAHQAFAKNSSSTACIVPVDSEHNSLFQLLEGQNLDHVHRIVLTASGGPFRDWTAEQIQKARREEVLNHPTWTMGPKITVDSAGMINKGLELIEARFLFSCEPEQLDVRIHRNSIVHSMIQLKDGSFHLSCSQPDMIFPVAHTLHYPESVPRAHPEMSFPEAWPALSFEMVDERFPGFMLCRKAMAAGGTAPAILNAANEVAVDAFLKDRISFSQIPETIDRALQSMPIQQTTELEELIAADEKTRSDLLQKLGALSAKK
ncbi:MAG TPA: 1-deoxy-D-xylulose-5-phosphate reductoisomerase [Leptospiraceae bacterium]|nr:1-deoxy-D-xylulose-5-phosphate reductoisomerase [Spirochaetaceae bacterium]HBS05507.1 1-deoxy-D-xylulose-5-phosphate reductoisomerase [Leptospiraceae bacterium]|tara:strand:- start:58341 stop:59564 length:1224 start_codon:yes stop_codon:yes gene_type:complete